MSNHGASPASLGSAGHGNIAGLSGQNIGGGANHAQDVAMRVKKYKQSQQQQNQQASGASMAAAHNSTRNKTSS